MATMRYLVHDVDAAVDFYVTHLGFALEQRWGPPFAIVSRDGLQLWLSGPGSSAARPLPDSSARQGFALSSAAASRSPGDAQSKRATPRI